MCKWGVKQKPEPKIVKQKRWKRNLISLNKMKERQKIDTDKYREVENRVIDVTSFFSIMYYITWDWHQR